MPKYYVATLARYVLVDATSEDEARRAGEAQFRQMHADLYGPTNPPVIQTVRLATTEEIELVRWHEEQCAREAEIQKRSGPR